MRDEPTFINTWAKLSPKSVEGVNNSLTYYYTHRLYKMLISRFKFDTLPDTFDLPTIQSVFVRGVLAVIDSGQGIYCLPCSTYGLDVYDRPTNVTVNNHHIIKSNYLIGYDAELVYIDNFQSCFMSAYPLILHYAEQLANIDMSLHTNSINSRVAFMFSSSNNQELQSMKLMYDEISQGRPAVFRRKSVNDDGDWVVFNNVKNTYVGNDLLLTKRTLINEYLTAIGINNANTDKRERLNSDEVHATDGEVGMNISVWLNNLKHCFEKINERFGFNITVDVNNYHNVLDVGGYNNYHNVLDVGGYNNESV